MRLDRQGLGSLGMRIAEKGIGMRLNKNPDMRLDKAGLSMRLVKKV